MVDNQTLQNVSFAFLIYSSIHVWDKSIITHLFPEDCVSQAQDHPTE